MPTIFTDRALLITPRGQDRLTRFGTVRHDGPPLLPPIRSWCTTTAFQDGGETPPWALQWKRQSVVLGVILSGVAVTLYSVADLVKHPVSPQWLILVALTVGSGLAMLRVPSMPISFSISDTFNIAAALLFGPSAGAITAAVDGLILSSRMESTRRSIDRVLFNMAAPTVALWIAAQVFFALGGNRPLGGPLSALRLLALLTLFGSLDFGLNSGIVAAAVSFDRRQPMLSIWRDHLAGVWITYFGGTFGAMLLMLLAHLGTVDALILIMPLPVILYVTFRHAIGRTHPSCRGQ